MTGGTPSAPGPGVIEILADTLRRLPASTRRGIQYVVMAYVGVLALQVWDSRDGEGARGFAELISVIVGTAGFLLLGLAHVLRAAAEPPPGRALTLTLSDPAPSAGPADSAAVRQILMTLPLVGTVSAMLLSSAVAFLVARVWLGSSAIVLGIAGVYLMAAAAAVYTVKDAAARLYAHGQEQATRLAGLETQLAEARLTALQAQMNPHFLFNALNTVASLTRSNPSAAEQTVENLSEVLRTTLDRSQEPRCTLDDELAFVRAYLAVERERFGPRLRVEYEIADGLGPASVPSFSLQPLVENSLKHGLGPRRDGGTLRIRAARDISRLTLTVTDDGDGFEARHQEGTGLGNLRARLQTMYGSDASLVVERSSVGAHVTVQLPLTFQEDGSARTDR
jgi:sensor histidine kinase YesM